jgi:hypothetical protein
MRDLLKYPDQAHLRRQKIAKRNAARAAEKVDEIVDRILREGSTEQLKEFREAAYFNYLTDDQQVEFCARLEEKILGYRKW